MKRRAKILFGIVLVAVAAAALLLWRHGGARRKLEAYKQDLLEHGEKLEIAELAPVAPEDSYAAARSFMTSFYIARRITNEPPLMKILAPGRALVAWQQETMPDRDNRATNIWPGLSVELQADRTTLSNLEFVLKAPALCFDLDYSQGFGLMLPHVGKLRQAEVLASAAAIAALHERDFGTAWKNLQLAVALVRKYRTEPLLVSHRVHAAMANIAIRTTWEFLQSDHWTDGQLAELQSDWESVEFFDVAAPAFGMERAMNIGTFRLLRKSYDEMATAFGGSSGPASLTSNPLEYAKSVGARWHYRLWQNSWSYVEESYFLEQCAAGLKAIHSTELTGRCFPALKGLQADTKRIEVNYTNDITHFLVVTFSGDDEWVSRSVIDFADAETERRLLIAAIALKRYHLRHGMHPADLNALVPEFLQRAPEDFMNGEPLRYKSTAEGNFLLYSVGEDGEDNGGDPTPTAVENNRGNNEYNLWLKGRDIVWPQPATADQSADYLKKAAAKFASLHPPANGRPVPTNAPAKKP